MAPGQRASKSGGRPGANGKDADTQSQTCLYLVRKPASANASRSELRGLTQNLIERDDNWFIELPICTLGETLSSYS